MRLSGYEGSRRGISCPLNLAERRAIAAAFLAARLRRSGRMLGEVAQAAVPEGRPHVRPPARLHASRGEGPVPGGLRRARRAVPAAAERRAGVPGDQGAPPQGRQACARPGRGAPGAARRAGSRARRSRECPGGSRPGVLPAERHAALSGHHRHSPGHRAPCRAGDAWHSDIRVTRRYVDVTSPLAADAATRMGLALFSESATKQVA